jgi:hypothetical protein
MVTIFGQRNGEDFGDMVEEQRRSSTDVLLMVLLALLVPLFFHKILLSGEPLFGSDFLLWFYPAKQFIYDTVRDGGGLPFWNPHVLSGTPFISNIQASMFYPLGFLFYLIPADQAYGYTVMLHFVLGAAFMYTFSRSIGLDEGGAFLSAVLFTFNGYFVAHLYAGHLTLVQSYIWIPLIFFWLNKFLCTRDFRFAVLSGITLGVQILGGFPQIAFYTIVAVILFASYHAFLDLKKGERTGTLRIAGGLLVVVLIGFSLSAVQILPTYEFSQLSSRSGGVSYAFATSDSFDPVHFITFLAPNFFGNLTNKTYWKSGEIWQFWEFCAYAGIGPLLLIGFRQKEETARRFRAFFFFLLLFALFLAMGRYNPFYRFVYHLPGFGHFRIPAQILFLYIFSVSILAGAGLSRMNSAAPYPASYRVMLMVVGLFLSALFLGFFLFPEAFLGFIFQLVQPSRLSPDLFDEFYEMSRVSVLTAGGFFALSVLLIHWGHTGRLGLRPLTGSIVLMVIVDLWLFSNPMIRTKDLSLPPDKTEVVKSLVGDSELFRVVTATDFLRPNQAMRHGYQNIEGYDPLILKRYLSYINKSQDTPQYAEAVHVHYVTDLRSKLIRMLNLKYAVQVDGRILDVPGGVPRAFMVGEAVVVPTDKALNFMMGEEFDPAKMVLLAPEDEPQLLDGKTGKDFEGSCVISHYDHKTIRIETSANKPGYLVMSEVFYPGWKAEVDGKEAPVLQGNYLFRVIPLSEGAHEVQLRFISRPFRIGVTISLFSLAACLGFILWQTRCRRRSSEQGTQ